METSRQPLGRAFYDRKTEVVAFELIGKILAFWSHQVFLSGKIVETEAYLGSEDPASHAYRGVTPRNRVMFGCPGMSYVYFTYGAHHCFNIVTETERVPGAVLIRALEPLTGIGVMKKRRKQNSVNLLTDGPGKLTEAFGITRAHSGIDLTQGPLCVLDPGKSKVFPEDSIIQIRVAKRIGISTAKTLPFRYFLAENSFVSKGS
ncbi:MAG: hypothetical protein A3A73_01425 [Omnitrophica bacterium RIFCSPLOWO2_01_FULL_50_24]|nr:MAG: hypothetical protein A3A73_01425 [Omnitrophica bacterium RIFCSPLOWO2_01_FULL_50_24]